MLLLDKDDHIKSREGEKRRKAPDILIVHDDEGTVQDEGRREEETLRSLLLKHLGQDLIAAQRNVKMTKKTMTMTMP